MDELYQEIVLDHGQHPRNVGSIPHPSGSVRFGNASCGDTIHIDFQIDSAGKIAELKWTGEGCVLSRAAASALSEWAVGRTVVDVQALSTVDMQALLGLPAIAPGRLKCLMLAVAAMQHME